MRGHPGRDCQRLRARRRLSWLVRFQQRFGTAAPSCEWMNRTTLLLFETAKGDRNKESKCEQRPGAHAPPVPACAGSAELVEQASGIRRKYLSLWHQHLVDVADFLQQHHRLPRRSRADGSVPVEEGKLGNWVMVQRQLYMGTQRRRGPLLPERKQALEALPGWHWDPHSAAWEQQFAQLLAFLQEHGRFPQQRKGTSATETTLATWCSFQRRRGNGTASPPLLPEQAQALEALPGWVWGRDEAWEQRLAEVAAFWQQHGRFPRTRGSRATPLVEGELVLGHWVGVQRRRLKGAGMCSRLTPEQQRALETLPGWRWDARRSRKSWEERLADLAAYNRLPRQRKGCTKEEHELAAWCAHQRGRYRGTLMGYGPMPADRVAALEALEGWCWDD